MNHEYYVGTAGFFTTGFFTGGFFAAGLLTGGLLVFSDPPIAVPESFAISDPSVLVFVGGFGFFAGSLFVVDAEAAVVDPSFTLSLPSTAGTGACPARPFCARKTISSGLSTPSPNPACNRFSSSMGSFTSGKCILERSCGSGCLDDEAVAEVSMLKKGDGAADRVLDVDAVAAVSGGEKRCVVRDDSSLRGPASSMSISGSTSTGSGDSFVVESSRAARAAAILCASFDIGFVASAAACDVEDVAEELAIREDVSGVGLASRFWAASLRF